MLLGLTLVFGKSKSNDKNILVLMENIVIRDTHSRFFKLLTGRSSF